MPAAFDECLILREHLLLAFGIEGQEAEVDGARSKGVRSADGQARPRHQQSLLARIVVDYAGEIFAKREQVYELGGEMPGAENRDSLSLFAPRVERRLQARTQPGEAFGKITPLIERLIERR